MRWQRAWLPFCPSTAYAYSSAARCFPSRLEIPSPHPSSQRLPSGAPASCGGSRRAAHRQPAPAASLEQPQRPRPYSVPMPTRTSVCPKYPARPQARRHGRRGRCRRQRAEGRPHSSCSSPWVDGSLRFGHNPSNAHGSHPGHTCPSSTKSGEHPAGCVRPCHASWAAAAAAAVPAPSRSAPPGLRPHT